MARPKPTILLDNTHPTTYKSEQVLDAEAIYAVFYSKTIYPRSLQSVDYPAPI